jgi:hypothetical protein
MTTIKLPRPFATLLNYASGPDTGTPTKVDVGTPTSGFVRGVAAASQNVNFELNALTTATRRPLTVASLIMRDLDPNGATISDTSAAIGVASATVLEEAIVVKGDTDGVFRFADFPLASQSGVTVSAITTDVRKLVGNGSRHLVVGDGGVDNAFSTNSGNTWSAGGATGLITPPTDCVWDGTQFIVSNDAGGSAHSTNGVAWTGATGGSDISDVLTGGHGNGLAVLSGGTVVAAGIITDPAFVKSTNHGLTWANTGGTVPSAHDFVVNRGWLAGNGGSEIYWLGSDGTGSLKVFVSTDGTTWTLRASVSSGLTPAANTPKLLMCQDTGLLVALLEQGFGGIVAMASLDGGRTWTERINTSVTSVHAFGLAKGRLFATVGDQLFASDGIGSE